MIQKTFRRKIWLLPLHNLLSKNLVATGVFLKHSTGSLSGEFIWHFETKYFRRKMLIPLLLSINFFASGKFLKHSTERFPYEYFRHCDRTTFRGKVFLLLPLTLSSKNLIATGVFLKDSTEGFPYDYFRYCDTKNFSTENLASPPSSPFVEKPCRYWSFSEIQHRRFFRRFYLAH